MWSSLKLKTPPKSLIQALSRWFLRHQRALPWRKTTDPFAIWISEVMLQQTQVKTVIPYYLKFLSAFPSVRALAEADMQDILSLWTGLGYYSRARNLKNGAEYLCKFYGGLFPNDLPSLLKVPGIGPYTAGAILSIAFDEPAAIVDGNIQRVFTRFHTIRTPLEDSDCKKTLWAEASRWVGLAKSPRILNQAMMELGATICTKTKPHCRRCPLAAGCLAHAKKIPDSFPVKRQRKKPVELRWVLMIPTQDDRFYLEKQTTPGWWHGLWGFPMFPLSREESPMDRALLMAPKSSRLTPLGSYVHHVTHHKIQVTPFVNYVENKKTFTKSLSQNLGFGMGTEKGRWFSRKDLRTLPMSSLTQKAFRVLE